MSYIEAEGVLVNANMKKGGKLLLQIEISEDLDNKEDYFHLRKMIERNVRFSLESTIVSYKVEINAKTNKPIREYKVDETGIVSEVAKPEGEQLEADLGLPKEQIPVKEEKVEADLIKIDEFIRSGLAPIYDDMTYDFPHILSRASDGVTYAKIAYELNISLGEFSVLMDDYRKRVAPLAMKWHEWKEAQENGGAGSTVEQGIVEGDDNQTESNQEAGDVIKQTDSSGDSEQSKDHTESEQPAGIDSVDVEGFILKNSPTFEDIQFDFPGLLKRKKDGETWMEIAQSLKISSTILQTAWNKYKKKVKEAMKGQDGAA
ncbi:hypothetical protein [Paenibacillus foliorum]|uniref:hypothetical protein n=1 Tax=Paenibacillus foliorum TaxID=2654974 RepID=UPI001C100EE6|nr:hypothetical protein [Paenibacillus foliorum]